jgi:tRNA(Ile)-lysidine synthase
MGPHPAVAEIRRAVRAALSGGAGPVLVACSGGPDSLALAAATAFEAPRAGRAAGLITIDHGLQDGSAAQARTVAAFGYELGLDPVYAVAVQVGVDGGPEAAARVARYGALDAAATAHGAQVLLGHTLDDQAETVLLGLGRGSGPRSIAGMRAAEGVYLRPFLGVRRAITVQACAVLGLSPWHDAHNDDPRFQRVRLRRLLPDLDAALQGGVAEALARTAALIRVDLDALDHIAAQLAGSVATGPELTVTDVSAHPEAIRTRVLRLWVRRTGVAVAAPHLASLDALLVDWHGQGPVQLPGGFAVVRSSGRLVLQPLAVG